MFWGSTQCSEWANICVYVDIVPYMMKYADEIPLLASRLISARLRRESASAPSEFAVPSPSFTCFFLFPRLPRRRLNQLNGHTAQTGFRSSVSLAELSGSAPVTPVLTSSFLANVDSWGLPRVRRFAANPGSGTASLDTCTRRYDSGGLGGGKAHGGRPIAVSKLSPIVFPGA